jgi:hypothetical protein
MLLFLEPSSAFQKRACLVCDEIDHRMSVLVAAVPAALGGLAEPQRARCSLGVGVRYDSVCRYRRMNMDALRKVCTLPHPCPDERARLSAIPLGALTSNSPLTYLPTHNSYCIRNEMFRVQLTKRSALDPRQVFLMSRSVSP